MFKSDKNTIFKDLIKDENFFYNEKIGRNVNQFKTPYKRVVINHRIADERIQDKYKDQERVKYRKYINPESYHVSSKKSRNDSLPILVNPMPDKSLFFKKDLTTVTSHMKRLNINYSKPAGKSYSHSKELNSKNPIKESRSQDKFKIKYSTKLKELLSCKTTFYTKVGNHHSLSIIKT